MLGDELFLGSDEAHTVCSRSICFFFVQGFFQGVESVWQAKGVVDTLRKLYNEPGKDRRVFVTGHSLGAALATVATGYLAFEEKMNIHGLYTTGGPR